MPQFTLHMRATKPLAAAMTALGLVVGVAASLQAAPVRQGEARIVVVAFPDLSGSGPRAPGCPGCDGTFTSQDSDASAADPLPLLDIILKDDTGAELDRRTTSALSDGRRPTSFQVTEPGTFTIELASVPDGWEICPNATTSRTVSAADFDDQDRVQVDFSLWHGCLAQVPTPTTGAPTSAPSPTASRQATAAPTAEIVQTPPGDGDADTEGDTGDDEASAEQAGMATATMPGEIRGLVFIDANEDGALGPSEPGVPGILVHLAGVVSGDQASSGAGTFAFGHLPAGAYDVMVDAPPGWRLTTSGRFVGVRVDGETVMGIDFGFAPGGPMMGVAQPPGPAPRLPSTGAEGPEQGLLLTVLAALVGAVALTGLALDRRALGRF